MPTRKDDRAAALLASGFGELEQGRAEQARLLGRKALEIVPRHPDALHLLGVIALHRADHAEAVELLKRAIAIRPDDPAYHCNLAYGYVGLKRWPEALAAFERGAALDAHDPDLQLGYGNCLAMSGKAAAAESVFRRLVERHPQHPLGWFNLANAVKDQERYEEARDLYVRATRLAPRLAEAHCNLGIALHKLERFDEADEAYRACLACNPAFIPAYVNLAITLNSLRRHVEAAMLCREGLARDPAQKSALPVLGRAMTGQHQWEEALRIHQEAAKEFPGSPDALGDLGEALAHTGRMSEALEAYERAISLGNASGLVHFLKATALFSAGRIAEGAAEYAGRPARSAYIATHPGRPLSEKLPQHLQGEEICLIGEQGIGDEIFFLRYAPLLKSRGCRIGYYCNPKLTGILARSSVLDRVSPNTGAFAASHHTMLVGDLPHLLSETEELPPPLRLQPLPDRIASVRERLRHLGPAPYIGLTWRAGTAPQDQRGYVWGLFKEISLESLAPALRGMEGTFLSLQRNPQARETERLATLLGRPVHDLSAANEDLEEMLALLAALDDYIGVSNTNMHLRAGTGKTAKVLVPWPAEWRWMAAGDESPWFPGFRIYRQRLGGSWDEALSRLREDLAPPC